MRPQISLSSRIRNHLGKEWILLKDNYVVLLLGAFFNYVHSVAHNLAYYLHSPSEPLFDIGFAILPGMAKEVQIVSEIAFFIIIALSVGFMLLPIYENNVSVFKRAVQVVGPYHIRQLYTRPKTKATNIFTYLARTLDLSKSIHAISRVLQSRDMDHIEDDPAVYDGHSLSHPQLQSRSQSKAGGDARLATTGLAGQIHKPSTALLLERHISQPVAAKAVPSNHDSTTTPLSHHHHHHHGPHLEVLPISPAASFSLPPSPSNVSNREGVAYIAGDSSTTVLSSSLSSSPSSSSDSLGNPGSSPHSTQFPSSGSSGDETQQPYHLVSPFHIYGNPSDTYAWQDPTQSGGCDNLDLDDLPSTPRRRGVGYAHGDDDVDGSGQGYLSSQFCGLCTTSQSSSSIPAPRYAIQVLSRFFAVLLLSQALRCLCFLITGLPGPNYHCRPFSPQYNPPRELLELFNRQDAFFSCGDLVFSSHTTFILLCALTYTKYGHNYRLKQIFWLIVSFFCGLVISARKHYTIDITIACYTVPLLWFVYDLYCPDELPVELVNKEFDHIAMIIDQYQLHLAYQQPHDSLEKPHQPLHNPHKSLGGDGYGDNTQIPQDEHNSLPQTTTSNVITALHTGQPSDLASPHLPLSSNTALAGGGNTARVSSPSQPTTGVSPPLSTRVQQVDGTTKTPQQQQQQQEHQQHQQHDILDMFTTPNTMHDDDASLTQIDFGFSNTHHDVMASHHTAIPVNNHQQLSTSPNNQNNNGYDDNMTYDSQFSINIDF